MIPPGLGVCILVPLAMAMATHRLLERILVVVILCLALSWSPCLADESEDDALSLFLNWEHGRAAISKDRLFGEGSWVRWNPADPFYFYNCVTGVAKKLGDMQALPAKFRVADIAQPRADPSVRWFAAHDEEVGVFDPALEGDDHVLRSHAINLSKLRPSEASRGRSIEWMKDVNYVALDENQRREAQYEQRVGYYHNFNTAVGSWSPFDPKEGWVLLVADNPTRLKDQFQRLGLISQWRDADYSH